MAATAPNILRGTQDIDIVINWNRKNLRATEAALQELGLVSRLPITADDVFQFRDEYIRNRNLVAWNFHDPGDAARLVDVVITHDLRGKRRHAEQTLGGPVHVLAIRDLIEMKHASGRPQDPAGAEQTDQHEGAGGSPRSLQDQGEIGRNSLPDPDQGPDAGLSYRGRLEYPLDFVSGTSRLGGGSKQC